MAYDIKRLFDVTTTETFLRTDALNANSYMYIAGPDDIATISAAGFFPSSDVKNGDMIMVSASDTYYFYSVSITNDVVSVANAISNYSPSAGAKPTWTTVSDPPAQINGDSYLFDFSSYVTGAGTYNGYSGVYIKDTD